MNKYIVIIKQFHEMLLSKSLGFGKLSHSSDMQYDAVMHRYGLTLATRGSTLVDRI